MTYAVRTPYVHRTKRVRPRYERRTNAERRLPPVPVFRRFAPETRAGRPQSIIRASGGQDLSSGPPDGALRGSVRGMGGYKDRISAGQGAAEKSANRRTPAKSQGVPQPTPRVCPGYPQQPASGTPAARSLRAQFGHFLPTLLSWPPFEKAQNRGRFLLPEPPLKPCDLRPSFLPLWLRGESLKGVFARPARPCLRHPAPCLLLHTYRVLYYCLLGSKTLPETLWGRVGPPPRAPTPLTELPEQSPAS